MAKTKVPAIPPIPPGTDPRLQRVLGALGEALDIRLGRRGDKLDMAVTFRDLKDSGFNIRDTSIGVPVELVDLSTNPVGVPSAPVNVQAIGAFFNTRLSWNAPDFAGYAYTEVWREPAQRVLLEGGGFGDWITTGANFGNAVLIGTTITNMYSDPVGIDQGYFYWVRHINTAGAAGPISAPFFASTNRNITEIMDALGDSIAESQLDIALRASLDGEKIRVDTIENGLSAMWTVRTDVNGLISGFGLYNDGETSSFIVNVDRFAVGTTGLNATNPFIIDGGVVYMREAMIDRAAITSVIVGNLIGDYGEFTSFLSTPNLFSPTINVGTLSKPDPLDPSTWSVFGTTRNGNFSVNAAGIMHATGAVLNGISIYDSNGVLIMGSGGGLDWSRVAGTGRPADGATVGAPNGTLVGGVDAATVASRVNEIPNLSTFVTNISSDNILTPTEKFNLRREWDSLQKEYLQLRTNASSAGISVTALQNAYIALGARLHNAAWTATASTTPFHISDAQLGVNSTITGSSLRTEYQTFYTQYSALVASLHVGAPSGTLVGGVSSTTVASRVNEIPNLTTFVNDISADGVLTPTEKFQLRREWDSLQKEYLQLVSSAAGVSVSVTAMQTAYTALGARLHNGGWGAAFTAVPHYISDGQLSVNTSISGASLRAEYSAFFDQYGLALRNVNLANVNAANPITSGTISTYIANLAVGALQIQGEAIFVPRFNEGTLDASLSSSETAAGASVTLTIAGLPSGATAGIVLVSASQAYATTSNKTNLLTRIYWGTLLLAEVGSTFGADGISVSNAAQIALGNGTYNFTVKYSCTASPNGDATKSGCTFVTKLIAMAGKR